MWLSPTPSRTVGGAPAAGQPVLRLAEIEIEIRPHRHPVIEQQAVKLPTERFAVPSRSSSCRHQWRK